jgi:GNAT superfamily N-acetyltransferase
VPATSRVTIRSAEPVDLDGIVALAGTALGWDATGPHAELFRWKHLDNPFGSSPMWLAECDGELAGFRTFLRWRWVRSGGDAYRAVRAVDTATHPAHQGKGIFTALTRAALPELEADGVDFVFNTPNDQSRPGYLRMGWRQLGRVPVAVLPAGVTGVGRMLRARQPAEKWSSTTAAGVPAPEFFADHEAVARLLASQPVSRHLTTDRTPALLSWRYGLDVLRYRCFPLGDRVEDGAVVFRIRGRGGAREATLCDVVAPSPSRARLVGALRSLLRASQADYLIATRGSVGPPAAIPLPGQGPILTWREVGATTPMTLGDFSLVLGDIELF